MKLIKLNKTHSLYRDGYTHAFRFNHFSIGAGNMQRTMERHFGSQYSRTAQWASKFGYRSHRDGFRVYWIGVKSEAMATMALLASDSSKK
jgi:hypothetical protein